MRKEQTTLVPVGPCCADGLPCTTEILVISHIEKCGFERTHQHHVSSGDVHISQSWLFTPGKVIFILKNLQKISKLGLFYQDEVLLRVLFGLLLPSLSALAKLTTRCDPQISPFSALVAIRARHRSCVGDESRKLSGKSSFNGAALPDNPCWPAPGGSAAAVWLLFWRFCRAAPTLRPPRRRQTALRSPADQALRVAALSPRSCPRQKFPVVYPVRAYLEISVRLIII